ncbi:hypothetical protein GCM10022219_11490 [Microbacterium oryzae]|uniref:XRE family transcriptional regulator n=1 Tax=Microbacterium oryzae TaxID=743009 RepID=A0A6I6E3G7_9MICO|nr:helix-turn-helix transcriptional regulator [Microbacterium oryzae]QGU28479.1 XRE family transcriptional regulator [Microbacterium oryzae]
MAPEEKSPFDVRFGGRIRSVREERGKTQAEVVADMRRRGIEYMNTSTLSRIEAGSRPVRLEEARVLARILAVSLDGMIAEGETIALVSARHRVAREKYVALREAVVNVTLAQLDIKHDVELLEDELKLMERDEFAFEAEILKENLESFGRIDILKDARELRDETLKAHKSLSGSRAGRFIATRLRK